MTTKKITPDVLAVLKEAKVDGNRLQLSAKLSRALYMQTANVIEMLGGKWDKREQSHMFPEDAGDRIAEAVMTGEVTDLKQLYQFFETPPALAARMVEMANIPSKGAVLEPSAGHGAIVREILKAHPEWLFAVELDELKCEKLKGELRGLTVYCGDFMEYPPKKENRYSRIIMNPPFNKGQDIAHVEHAYDLLAPGGRLVAITSPAWQYRTGKWAAFKNWLDDVSATVVDLPEGTFAVSGTNVRACLLSIDKP